MLADTLSRTELTGVVGLLYAAGLSGGNGYAAFSEDSGATNYEAPVKVADDVDEENPALTLGPGGEWFSAFVLGDKVRVYRSRDHCGSWAVTQTLQ
jgi:hypothetical protein